LWIRDLIELRENVFVPFWRYPYPGIPDFDAYMLTAYSAPHQDAAAFGIADGISYKVAQYALQ
jgi:hypothetical protein